MDATAIGWVDDLFHLFGAEPPPNFTLYLALTVVLLPLPVVFLFIHSSRPRQGIVPPYRERVLILGASSGVGRELALQYAHRGCRHLVLVGRREAELAEVKRACELRRKEGEEWDMSQQAPGWEEALNKEGVTVVPADCTKPEDLLRIRQEVRKAMGGLDTLHIVFGASALRSLLGIANVDPITSSSTDGSTEINASNAHATLEGIQATSEAARKIMDTNVASTAAVLATFVPLLQLSSPAPAAVLLSSVAALVPAPTRSLYAASKAAQLSLFLSVGIEDKAQTSQTSQAEHSPSKRTGTRTRTRFFALAPATIRTDFRLSAVDVNSDDPAALSSLVKDAAWDAGKGEGDSTTDKTAKRNGNGNGKKSDILEPSEVAHAAIRGADRMAEGVKAMPGKYRFVRFANLLVPGVIDNMARKKYGY